MTSSPAGVVNTLVLSREDVAAAVDAGTGVLPNVVDCGPTAYWNPDTGACVPLEVDNSGAPSFFSQYKMHLIIGGTALGVGALALYLFKRPPGKVRTKNKAEDPNWVEAYQLLEQAKDYLITRRDVGHAKLRVLEAMHHARKLPAGEESRTVLERDIDTVIRQINRTRK
jgi:hypothetical protein